MKYVYVDPITNQVMAIFDTPNLANQESPIRRGWVRLLVPDGMTVTRDHMVTLTDEDLIIEIIDSVNSVQPQDPIPSELDLVRAKVKRGDGVPEDLVRMKQLELGG
ncbi:hypothetical protein LCGC14_2054310 [marine sediment metagenome]|uniref:Uncharacterized protein n=1 Tax=marine sediment metagenome TaxID=412755 RepID=A0A0F9FAI5_9ZZZZ